MFKLQTVLYVSENLNIGFFVHFRLAATQPFLENGTMKGN